MIIRSLRGPIIGLVTLILAGPAAGQESLDKGKTPPSYSRRTARHVTNRREGSRNRAGFSTSTAFCVSIHTASRESATAIANYLKSMESGPGRATKRATKGDEKAKSEATKKPAAKAEEGKGAEKKPDAASEEPKPLGYIGARTESE
mgnify:CR=1 FL=1